MANIQGVSVSGPSRIGAQGLAQSSAATNGLPDEEKVAEFAKIQPAHRRRRPNFLQIQLRGTIQPAPPPKTLPRKQDSTDLQCSGLQRWRGEHPTVRVVKENSGTGGWWAVSKPVPENRAGQWRSGWEGRHGKETGLLGSRSDRSPGECRPGRGKRGRHSFIYRDHGTGPTRVDRLPSRVTLPPFGEGYCHRNCDDGMKRL